MQEFLYIQNIIYVYKDNYIIKDIDLSKLFKINVRRIIKKYKNLFDNNYCFKINNIYLLKKEGIVLITMLINSYYLIEITDSILIIIDILKSINKNNILNKVSINNI